jgi:hypothetical protein
VSTARNWIAGVLTSALLLALCAAVDDQPTESQDVADDAASAWMDSDNRGKRDAMAQVLCDSELGAGTHVLWTREGDLVCRPAAHLVAKGGAL